jgi:hypothetical protein
VYKKPKAVGEYHTRFYKPGGIVLEGSLTIYENGDGTYGFHVTVNPVDGEVGPSECKPLAPTGTPVTAGGYCFTVDIETGLKEFFNIGPLWRFTQYLYSSNGTGARSALALALNATTDLEYNVPRIVERGNSTVLVYHSFLSKWSGSTTFTFKALSISSFGAVYANAILPIDISLPPPAYAPPPSIPTPSTATNSTTSSQQNKPLRTYIVDIFAK